jgi:hypothetical protein
MYLASIAASLFAVSSSTLLANQPVYTTKLQNGWSDWSWAKLIKGSNGFTAEMKPWQSVYFHHATLDSWHYNAIQFKVYGGHEGGQVFRIQALVHGRPVFETARLVVLPGRWFTVDVPFCMLGLTHQRFDGFWIQAQRNAIVQMADFSLITRNLNRTENAAG